MDIKAFKAYCNRRITKKQFLRYGELHRSLMGNNSFVEIEDTPDWREFQELTTLIYN